MDFRDFPAFKELSVEQFRHFATACQYGTLPPGKCLIRQGEVGSRIMFILKGQVRVHLQTDMGDRDLNQLSGPTVLGEISFFSGDVSSASVTTSTEVEIMIVPFNKLRARLYAGDASAAIVVLHLASAIAQRANAMTATLSQFYTRQAELETSTRDLFGEWSFL